MLHFIRTVSINGKPLVLRFNKVSDTLFHVQCINAREIADMSISQQSSEWKITEGGNEDILRQESRILNLLDDRTVGN